MHQIYDAPLGWLWQGGMFFLLLGLILSIGMGLILLVAPARAQSLNLRLSRWVDTDELANTMNQQWEMERGFYRHHRWVGMLLIAGASFVLWQWAFNFDRDAMLSLLAPTLKPMGLDWMVEAAEWVVVGVHVAGILLGVVVLLRPSLMKNLEHQVNHWYSPLRLAEILDREFDPIEQALARFPRGLGLAVVLMGLIGVWMLAPVLLPGIWG